MSASRRRDIVFDLDNTLYPVAQIYDEIGERMTAYIARALRVPADEALVLRERYFHQYGATVTGLSKHHNIDAHDFMANVHDVDYSTLTPDPELAALIARIPGRRIVFTNGGGGHGHYGQGGDEQYHSAEHVGDAFDGPVRGVQVGGA